MTAKPLDSINEQLSYHFGVMQRCTVETEKYGRLLLATPPDTRYPYVYPRDVRAAIILLRRIACSEAGYDMAKPAFDLIESTARFMTDACKAAGGWGQRFSVEGEDKGIYRQEDNMAHGIAIICNYLLTARELRRDIAELEDYFDCVNSAAVWSLENLYHKELHLFHSTTSIHESAMESGYTCWVNFSFLHAFSLLQEVADVMDPKKQLSRSHLAFRNEFFHSVNQLFMTSSRYFRRINVDGQIDFRPDFTLLSPFYYGFHHNKHELDNSVNFIEKQLWDPELGMIMRYLPFDQDFATHVHAGNGPWLQYTAILAQYHYWNHNEARGDELLGLIDGYRNEKGEIPEHLSTCKRFENFMAKEWRSGIDFAKEFHKPILLPRVDFDKILEEANNMQASYQHIGESCMISDSNQAEGGYIQFAAPLMWSHAEYARALMLKAGDWWDARRV